MSTPPLDRMRFFENFGHSLKSPGYLAQPRSVDEILQVFKQAKAQGLSIALRGAGRSYNDASLNGGGIVLDLQGMNRILEWDPGTGVIAVEPGVTLQDLWQKVLPDGWWPPVVSGTMTTTLGGCLGANIHGKNNFRAGTIGEHVVQFTALLPSGAEITCSPRKNGDLFHAMIGGLGLLGVFTSITLQMKKVHSGLLQVRAWRVPNLAIHLQALEESAPGHAYTVGWMDTTARGKSLGRGQLHTADYLEEGEDSNPGQTLQVAYQTLPDTFFGILPKSVIYRFMSPFMNNPSARVVNTAKYIAGRKSKSYQQPQAAYHFLLDYIPNWERAYGQLVQYQSFVPLETAQDTWIEMLTLSHKQRIPAYLGVTKRHRPDDFLLTHAVDGFSLAMDFKVTRNNREELRRVLHDFDRIVLEAGGRFYFAKNSETSAETTRCFLGEETVARFLTLKKRCDPNGILETDLFRRLFLEKRS
jgi:decaprenylphospho-beta-D-ribofuranose 2-oxidase